MTVQNSSGDPSLEFSIDWLEKKVLMPEGKRTEAQLQGTHMPPPQDLPPPDIQHTPLFLGGFQFMLGQPALKGL